MARFSWLLMVCVLLAAPAADGLEQTEAVPVEEPVARSPRQLLPSDPMSLRGPVDEARYIVGPGDELLIVIWGKSAVTHTASVGPEGELVLPGVAPIPIAGLTLRDAKERVAGRLGDIYRNVEISVSLSSVRTMRVSVLGNVLLPGEYTGTALDLAGEMIEMAGGLGEGASERNISIRRRGGGSDRVDLVRYRNAGDMDANPPILDGDVVFVPNAVALVEVDGAVSWPGTYELGLLRRFVDSRTTRSVPVDASDPESLRLPLSDGDQVYVRSETEWRESQRVFVEGEVAHPGPYGINEGVDRLSQVIRRAGGLTERASMRDARIVRELDLDDVDLALEWLSGVPVRDMGETERAYWKSRTQDEPGTVVSDLGRALAGDVEHDVLLMDGDRI
jgi:protein involved in polysaccharide export with SLBB domain